MTTNNSKDEDRSFIFYILLALLFLRPLVSGIGMDYFGARAVFDAIVRNGFPLCVVLCVVISKRRIIFPAPYGMAIWMVAALMSLVWTRFTGRSWFVSIQRLDVYFSLAAVAVAVATYSTDESKRRKIIEAFLAGLLIAAAYGVWQYFFGLERASQYISMYGTGGLIAAEDAIKVLGWKRVFSTTFSPDIFAGMMASAAPLALAYIVSRRKEKDAARSAFGVTAFILSLVALYLTGSLGGWLAAGFGFAVLGTTAFKSKKNKIMAAVVLAAVFILASAGIVSRRADTFKNLKHVNNPIAQRYYYWKTGAFIYADNAMFGVGPGHFGNAYLAVKPEEAGATKYAHNFLVQYASELGTPGALGFVLMALYFTARATKLSRRNVLNAGILSSGCAFLAHSLIDYDTEIIEAAYIFYVALGLSAYEDRSEKPAGAGFAGKAISAIALVTIVMSLWSLVGARYMQDAKDYINDGDPAKAAAALEKARYFRRMDPEEAKLEARLFLSTRGYERQAVDALERLVALDRRDPFSMVEFGNYYLYRGDYAKAEEFFAAAARLYPTFPTARASAYFCWAHVLLEKGDLAGAKNELQKVLKEFPNHKGAVEGLNYIAELEKNRNK